MNNENIEDFIQPVLKFLQCETPEAWTRAALSDLATLLQDHAVLELKAAQQAQKLIWKYGLSAGEPDSAELRLEMVQRMSRLAREELRHFEQVSSLLVARSIKFQPVSASRYAESLHRQVRSNEPARLIDTLIVGAIIEARSCERFYRLSPMLAQSEPQLARFYDSLLRSEARHFEDYLDLAEKFQLSAADGGNKRARERAERLIRGSDTQFRKRVATLLACEAELVLSPDSEFRFHSGAPAI